MNLAAEDIEKIERISLPARWGVRHKLGVAEVAWLIEPESERIGKCRLLRPDQPRTHELAFASAEGEEIVVVFEAPSAAALQHERIVRAKGAAVVDALLDLSSSGAWQKHPAQASYSADAARQQRDAVLSSWVDGIIYRSDKNGGRGLRTPQIGALHAIAAHWSVSQKPGIIVMPTGTGKTEVMVATTLAPQCRIGLAGGFFCASESVSACQSPPQDGRMFA